MYLSAARLVADAGDNGSVVVVAVSRSRLAPLLQDFGELRIRL